MKTLVQSLFLRAIIVLIILNGLLSIQSVAQTLPAGGGTYYIDNTASGAQLFANGGSYFNTLTGGTSSAITAINNLGATSLTGNVTFNVTAGANGSFSTAELDIIYTHSNGHTITFINSGTPGTNNPVWTGTGTANTSVVALKSADNIIFNGIDFATTASTGCSWGVVLLGTTGDGCQNNMVENCKISNFNNATANSGALVPSGAPVGIGVIAWSIATSASGENNTNYFYNNWVTNVISGYLFNGISTALPDNDNEVGISGTGISKISAFGLVANASSTSYGINYTNQTNFKAFNTLIDNANATTTYTVMEGIISTGAAANTGNIYSNTISNIAQCTSVMGVTFYGVYSASLNTSIYNNVIASISSNNQYSTTYGIWMRGGTTISIYNNLIHGFNSSASTNAATAGIGESFNTNTCYVYNNMIYDIRADKNNQGIAGGGGGGALGISLNNGTNAYVYNNTVYLAGTASSSVASSQESAALYLGTTANFDMRNNILVNKYAGNNLRAVAFYKANNTYTNISTSTNNNLLYCGTPDAVHLLLYDNTSSAQLLNSSYGATTPYYQTLMNARTADQNSVTGDPGFVSGTSPFDVHIVPCTSTSPALYYAKPISTSGTPAAAINITTDIDGNTRGAGTILGSSPAPTIGADEIYTISVTANTPTNPAMCGGNGGITLNGNLAAYTTYSVAYNLNASPVSSANYTTDGSGNLVIAPLLAGTYSNFVLTLGACSSPAYPVSAGTIVLTAPCGPNVTDFHTSAAAACAGSGSVVTITSTSLGNGTFTITYNLSGGNTATGNTASCTISGTTGTFTTSGLANAASTTIVITSVTAGGSATPSSGNTAAITVNALPTPTFISPITAACANQAGYVYSTQTGQTNYNWTISGGAITIGGGTNSSNSTATVTWGVAGTGSITINYSTSGCTAASPTSQSVAIGDVPATPATPAGSLALCQGSSPTAYTSSAIGANSYNWSVTGGSNAVSGTGTSATVTWDASFSGTAGISVTATNTCGTTPSAGTANVVVNAGSLSVPSAPSGTTTRCFGSGTGNYTTSSVVNATSYTWSITSGAGSISGTGTSATVTWSVTYTGTASISVTANGSCGSSAPATTSVTVNGLNGTYIINNAISGALNLYPNTNVFNSFASAIAALGCGVTGPVLFNVANGTYNEQVFLPAVTGASATNTITFDGGTGNAANVKIRCVANNTTNWNLSAFSNAAVTFNACHHITVKNITINDNMTANYGVLFFGAQSSITCFSNNLLNCNVYAPVSVATATDVDCILFSSLYNGQGTNNANSSVSGSNITISGCQIHNGTYGVAVIGNNSLGNLYQVTISNNTVTNVWSRGLYVTGANACKILNNTVTSNSANYAGVSAYTGIYVASCNAIATPVHDNIEVSGNIVPNFNRIGIFISGCPIAAVSFADQYTKIFNNEVGGSVSSSATSLIGGLDIASNFDCYVWNNTCNLNFSTAATTGAFVESANNTIDIRNNIFEYSGASAGPAQAMYSTSTSSVTRDYNLLYNTNNPTGLTTAVIANQSAFIGSTQYYGTGAIPTAGSNSVYADPKFVNAATNLDITFQCTRGIDLGLTTDIHGNTRPYTGETRPNMGADEIAPSVVGAVGTISGTSSLCVGTSGVTYSVAAISFATGYNWTVPTGATITAGSNTNTITVNYSGSASSGNVTVQGTNGACSGATGTLVITVNSTPPVPGAPSGATSRCVGANTGVYTTSASGATSYAWSVTGSGNTVSGTGNTGTVTWNGAFVGTASISVTATNGCGTSSAASTIVTVNGLNGTYIINKAVSGAINLYPNTNVFNSFRSAIVAMTCGIGGPVLFNVSPGNYNEQVSVPIFSSAVPFNTGNIPGASAINTITFDGGSPASVTIDSTAGAGGNIAELTFNGCSYVTFKNMTITNTTATNGAGYGVLFYGQQYNFTYGSTCNFDQLINCVVNAPVSTSAAGDIYGIVLAGATSSISGTPGNFTNNLISGCTINNGSDGIEAVGAFNFIGTITTTANTFSNNIISNAYDRGILLIQLQAPKVKNNTVSTNGPNATNRGIHLTGCLPTVTDFIEVSGNVVLSFNQIGIWIQNSPPSTSPASSSILYSRIYNNMAIANPVVSTSLRSGIYLQNTVTAYVWHNSLNLNAAPSGAFGVLHADANSGTNVDIENNILEYSGVASANANPLVTLSSPSPTINSNLLYNANNASGSTTAAAANQSASIGGTQYYGTGAIPAAGANSVYANPQFVNPSSNLDITFQCTRGLNLGLATDIHGSSRPFAGQTLPSMGADEIGLSVVGAAGTINGSASICAVQNGVVYSVPSISFATGYNWTVPSGASIVAGSNTNSITVNYPVTASSGNVTVQGTNGTCTGAGSTLAVAVNTTPTIAVSPLSGNICVGDVLQQTASGANTYTWLPATGLDANTASLVNASPVTSTTYTVTGTSLQGCTANTTDIITVKPTPAVNVTPDNAVCTGGTTATLVASGAVSYTWSPTTNLTPSNGTSVTETAQISALTIYTVTGTGTNGCTASDVVPVATVAVGGTISPLYSIICSGGTKLLTVSGAAGHDYQWQISGDNSSWTPITGATNTTYTTNTTDGNTNKYYRLLAQSNSCWNVASTTAEVDVSQPVINVAASAITDNSVLLSWLPVGQGNYNITYSGTSSGTVLGTTPPKTLTGLTANGSYTITLNQTGTGLGGCPASGTVNINTLCSAPPTVTVISTGTTSITLSWSGGAGNYRVYYRPLYAYNNYFSKDVINGTSTTITNQGNNQLYSSVTYEVYVVKLDCPGAGNIGQPSAKIYATTSPALACAAPVIDSVRSLCPVQIEVWVHGSPTNQYYVDVERLTPTVQPVTSYPVTGSYFTMNVSAGQNYLITSRSICGGAVSNMAIWPGSLQIKPQCGTLSNLLVSSPTCYGFTASWNADQCIANNASYYQLFIRQVGTINWNGYGVTIPVFPIGPYKVVSWVGRGKTYDVFAKAVYSCNGYLTYGATTQTLRITTLSAGCREEDQQQEEIRPSTQQTSADNNEVFSLYPNPNSGQFRVDLSRLNTNEDAVRIEVTNMLGQTILTHLTSINDGHLAEFINLPASTTAGTCVVRLTAGKNVYTAKINISK